LATAGSDPGRCCFWRPGLKPRRIVPEKPVPFGFAPGRLSTSLRFARDDDEFHFELSQVSNHPSDEDLSLGTPVKSRPGAPIFVLNGNP
jgi:hypothetical protein